VHLQVYLDHLWFLFSFSKNSKWSHLFLEVPSGSTCGMLPTDKATCITYTPASPVLIFLLSLGHPSGHCPCCSSCCCPFSSGLTVSGPLQEADTVLVTDHIAGFSACPREHGPPSPHSSLLTQHLTSSNYQSSSLLFPTAH
jgi:hypothetical protein